MQTFPGSCTVGSRKQVVLYTTCPWLAALGCPLDQERRLGARYPLLRLCELGLKRPNKTEWPTLVRGRACSASSPALTWTLSASTSAKGPEPARLPLPQMAINAETFCKRLAIWIGRGSDNLSSRDSFKLSVYWGPSEAGGKGLAATSVYPIGLGLKVRLMNR